MLVKGLNRKIVGLASGLLYTVLSPDYCLIPSRVPGPRPEAAKTFQVILLIQSATRPVNPEGREKSELLSPRLCYESGQGRTVI